MALYTKNQEALYQAIKSNDMKETKKLLKIVENEETLLNQKRNLLSKEKDLFEAARNNNIQAVKRLLDDGINIEARGNAEGDRQDRDFTALMYAVGSGHIEMIKFLIDKGADIYAINGHEYTPLLIASIEGYFEIAKLLIEIMETRSEQN